MTEASDLLDLPNRGFGNAFLHVMASRCPIVAAELGGVPGRQIATTVRALGPRDGLPNGSCYRSMAELTLPLLDPVPQSEFHRGRTINGFVSYPHIPPC
jgi:hypothetical protein